MRDRMQVSINIHLYSPNNGSMSEEKIYIGLRRKVSNKNTEAELNNFQTPRLFA